ncbi:ABC transporter ATP-binding protein [Dactylosporangium fulvum]|uniref:ABC transporter ATP-binding protein n=1 Tax=Dactylosporangium fulvum TaxID=53359 RepID=A0ABY5VSH9_9ACTN|nr:ABC transporter ATP-binding protein [Dactylosporangium fulvum]UWP79771.1 ABC transporter ATP-binding protein [Dactylosporangium fulvum]
MTKPIRTAASPPSTESARGSVRIDGVSCGFDATTVLRGLDLTIDPGEFLTLLGPSGSGKTTLLRVIAGLIEPRAGRVVIDGADVTKLPPQKRDLGFVFQNYALFPHLTVRQNIEYPLKVRKIPTARRQELIAEMLDIVGLTGMDKRYPSQLSGGQQQRVALARSLVHRPKVLLLDEPLGALDRRLRQELGRELRRIQRETGTTAIYVTHDQEEAFVLSDRIGIMRDGLLTQLGAPIELYQRPSDLFVAGFLGDVNLVAGSVVERGPAATVIDIGGSRLPCRAGTDMAVSAAATCVIRPEHLSVRVVGSAPTGDHEQHYLANAVVDDAYFLGQAFRLKLSWQQGSLTADVDAGGRLPAVGEEVSVFVRADAASIVRSHESAPDPTHEPTPDQSVGQEKQ